MTISEIARMAGVSSAAVSRYFNNGYVSDEKRKAIRRAVEKTGYRPSVQAQALRTRKTKMIGLILPRVNNGAIGSMVDGILPVFEENGFQILLAVTQNKADKEVEYLSLFDEKQVDGIILIGTVLTEGHKKRFCKMNVPLVVVGQDYPGCYCVYQDEFNAICDLTRLMLRKGRTRLGFVGALRADRAAGLERLRGFWAAVEEAGLGQLKENVEEGGFTMLAGYEKARKLWERTGGLDGIVCATDQLAMGSMQFLKEQGLRIPEEVMIAGLGDSSCSWLISPSLTTVHYAYQEAGAQGARMLLDLIHKDGLQVSGIMMKYHLVERESTGGENDGSSLDHWTEH